MAEGSKPGSTTLYVTVALLLAAMVAGIYLYLSDDPIDYTVPPPLTGEATTGDSPADPEETLRGRVLDAETGAGLGGAVVSLGASSATAGATGEFEIAYEAGGALEVAAEGFFPQTLEDPRPRDDAEIALFAMCALEGRTSAETSGGDPRPVPNARLSLVWLAPSADGRFEGVVDLETRTDAAGKFALALPPGRVRVLAEADGFALGESREIRLVGGRATTGIEIDMGQRGDVKLTVLDEEGAPIKDATVEAMGLPSWRVQIPVTRQTGQTTAADLPVGEMAFRVSANHFSMVISPTVEVKADDEVALEVVLPSLKGISGRVVTPEGAAAARASVILEPTHLPTGTNTTIVTANTNGGFHFDGLDVGRYRLVATHPFFSASTPIEIESTEQGDLTLTLEPGGAISGEVNDGAGEAVSRFVVVIERFVPEAGTPGVEEGAALSGFYFEPRRFDDGSGRFRFDGLAPGAYNLYVSSPEHGPGRAEEIEVQGGRTTGPVEITLGGGASLSGAVLDAETREPIVGAVVRVDDYSKQRGAVPPRTSTTSTEGTFEINGVSPGRRTIEIEKEGFTTRFMAGVQLQEGQRETFEILLVPLPADAKPQIEFFGIGAVLATTERGTIQIKQTLEGAPGARGGLQEDDEILRVDGQDAITLGLGRAVELIRGEEGSSVELEVQREGEPYPFKVEIERGRVVYEK